jgi:hypothetical protein
MRSFILTAALAAFAVSPAMAQMTTPPPLPANTSVDCSAFTKLPNGKWHLIRATTVTVGGTGVNFQKTTIAPRRSFISNVDVYAVLEQKCGR